MQQIVFEKPYRFVPPIKSPIPPTIFRELRAVPWFLVFKEGIMTTEIRNQEVYEKLVRDGHAVVLCPNHCRNADPLMFSYLTHATKTLVYAVASWHLFQRTWFEKWGVRLLGGYSILREGTDRQSLDTSIDILTHNKRPLIVFAEGGMTRNNDRLHPLLDGVGFIARMAAKKRHPEGKKVYLLPIALKYHFRGDAQKLVSPALTKLEAALTLGSHEHEPLIQRVFRVGEALLAVQEVATFGRARSGSFATRRNDLIEGLLVPIEKSLNVTTSSNGTIERVKNIRMRLMTDLMNGTVDQAERARRWLMLERCYRAQQIDCYPIDYLRPPYKVDRVVETVERFEEDLFDRLTVYKCWHAVMEIGDPIEVTPSRPPKGQPDPAMAALENQLRGRLTRLSDDSLILPTESPDADVIQPMMKRRMATSDA